MFCALSENRKSFGNGGKTARLFLCISERNSLYDKQFWHLWHATLAGRKTAKTQSARKHQNEGAILPSHAEVLQVNPMAE
jgi:hypothetical protein